MDNSALLELFMALNGWQLRAARLWIEIPGNSHREASVRLFDYLCGCRDKSVAFDKSAAIEFVFGKKNGDIAALRHQMSALSDLLRDFFLWEEMRQIPGHKEWLRLRAMRKLGLEKNFQLALRDADKILGRVENQTVDQHLLAFRVKSEQYEWAENQKRGHEFSLETLQVALDAWYAGQLLQLACMDQSRQNVRRIAPTLEALHPNLDELLNLLPSKPHKHIPTIAIYHLGQRMLANPEDGNTMEAYREMLARHIQESPTSEARDLLMLAINHGIRRINAGDKDAIRRTLEFYLLGLEKKLLHDEQGKLSKYTYNNVLMSFLALEAWDEAATFLERFKEELPSRERDNIYQYNCAIYHFRKGDFDAALDLLRGVSLQEPMYKLESRKMLLKIYYEQDATAALESLLENLLLWLRRHGEIGYHREMYRNLARFTGQLLRLPPGAKSARGNLEKKIIETPLVAERAWLLEKLRKKHPK